MKGELIFGVNPVKESLQGTRGAYNLYVQISATDHRVEKIIRLAEERGVAVHRRDKLDLTKMCASSHHQGIALEVEPFRYSDFDDLLTSVSLSGKAGFILVLDAIQDPHNLGACLRVADAFGVHAVVAPKDRAVGITSVVSKVASGAAETIPYITVTNLARTLRELKDAGVWIVGTDDQAPASLFDVRLDGPLAWVLGAEGEGMRRLTREHCDQLVRIPMAGKVESLNVSVASGVCLFETARQRQQKN